MKPSKVWVVYGGDSTEREVSLNSGKNIVAALEKKAFNVNALEISSAADLVKTFAATALSDRPDIVFIGLHGRFGEDGQIQGYLDTLGVPFVGSGLLSSALCMNKVLTQKILKEYGFPIAKSFEISKKSFHIDELLQKEPKLLNKKYFIKAASQGSTLGLFRYDPQQYLEGERKDAFDDLCKKVFDFDEEALVEEWIEGRELTCAVVQGKAFPLIEIRPNSKFYDYKSKYTSGQTEYLCPAPLENTIAEKISGVCERAFKAMRCADYARVDVMLNEKGEFFILELNTLPGMTATSLVPKAAKAMGINFEDFIETLTCSSFERQMMVRQKK